MFIFKNLKKSSGLRINTYKNIIIYKNYLYPLKRKIFIFKSLKRSLRLRTGRTKA